MKCIIVVIFCVAIIFLICIAWGKGRESDLTETHYVYKASGKDDLERVNQANFLSSFLSKAFLKNNTCYNHKKSGHFDLAQ